MTNLEKNYKTFIPSKINLDDYLFIALHTDKPDDNDQRINEVNYTDYSRQKIPNFMKEINPFGGYHKFSNLSQSIQFGEYRDDKSILVTHCSIADKTGKILFSNSLDHYDRIIDFWGKNGIILSRGITPQFSKNSLIVSWE